MEAELNMENISACAQNSCGLDKYKDIVQLYDKDRLTGRVRKVFPITYTQAVYDGKTGASLESILAQYNNVFLQFMGTAEATRVLLPKEMRRKGIQISYRNMEDEVIVEKCVNDSRTDDTHWGLSANWARIDELSLSGEISVSAKGTWIINGEDTGIKAVGPKGDNGLTPWLKTIDNKLYHSYDNKTWEPSSDYIAAWFRFTGTSGSSQADNIGKMQISRDEGKTWTDLSGTFTNNLRISGYRTSVDLIPEGQPQGAIWAIGPTYASDDTAHTNPIYRLHVKDESGWVDNGQFTSIAAGVVQELGDSETEVISQKAVTKSSMEYNVSVWNEGEKYTLADAINLVPTTLRRLGQKVCFTNVDTNLAETWMYIGTDSNSWNVSNFICSDAGFYGQIFDTKKSPYNLDNLKKTGIYIKKNGTPYILFVKAEEETVKQIRLYVQDYSIRYVIGKRQYSQSTDSWSDWELEEFATENIAFDGFLDAEDSEADNYIDKITTTGIYRRKKNDVPIIYFVKTINGVIYQTQFYFNDSAVLTFRVRHLSNNAWTAWSNGTVTMNVRTFKFEELDNLKSYGTFVSSDSYNSGVLYVMKSSLPTFDFTQIIFINDTNSGKLKKGIRHHDVDGIWLDWGWEEVGDITLQSLIAKTGVLFNLSIYPQYHGYISQRDLTVSDNENYRTISVPIEDIPDGQKFLTIPCQGGAILLVGYWKGDYNDSSNYLGRDSITAFSLAESRMYTNVPLSNLIPEGTTHMTLCWNIVGSPKLTIYNPDLNPYSECGGNVSGTILPSTYLGQREVVYGGMNNAYLYKRGALLNITGNHDDLIIVAGQSNADGRANKSEAPQWLIDMNYKIENYMMWNPIAEQFQSWELGVNTGSEDNASNQFGFDIYFAKKYLEANPTKKLYAIKQSVGGTPISPLRASGETRAYCWTPMPELITDGGTSMCNQLLEKVRKAYLYASRNNINLAPQALLWHQGEADMTDTRAPYFEDNLKGLFSWMRGIWAAPALPIINGQISSHYDTEWQPTYSANKAFAALNGIDPYFKTVNMEDQAIQPDNVHFAAEGYEHMGYGMWSYYLEFNPIYKPNTASA